MKRIVRCLLLLFVLLAVSSCMGSGTEKSADIAGALKIRTWLLDEKLEGTGRWGYISREERTYPFKADGDGYWIPDDGVTQVDNEDVFVFEELEVGVPRTMAPMTMHMAREGRDGINYSNLNLHIDFDGMVEVVKLEPDDSSIRLRYSLDGPPIEAGEGVRVNGPCVINLCPVGKVVVSESTHTLISPDTLAGKEYLLQIRGCSWDGTPIVTADVKLTSVHDPEYPWQTIRMGGYGELRQSGEERTRFCTVELLSYEYSEMYLLEEEAPMAEGE